MCVKIVLNGTSSSNQQRCDHQSTESPNKQTLACIKLSLQHCCYKAMRMSETQTAQDMQKKKKKKNAIELGFMNF